MKVEIINKKMLCWDIDEGQAKELLVLAKVTDCETNCPFKTLNSNGYANWFKNAKPLPSTKRTIKDGLEVDDVIEIESGERKILGVCGNIVIPSALDQFHESGTNYTLAELIHNGYKLKQPEEQPKEEIIELSFKDISEGKGVGIPEHLIRIKDE